jgi:hypothetical protein
MFLDFLFVLIRSKFEEYIDVKGSATFTVP